MFLSDQISKGVPKISGEIIGTTKRKLDCTREDEGRAVVMI